MKLLSAFILNFLPLLFSTLTHEDDKQCKNFALTLLGFLFLSSGFVLGSMGLYNYLVSLWGAGPSLLALSLLYMGIGLLLVLASNFKKHQESPQKPSCPLDWGSLLKTFEEFSADKTFSKITSHLNLKALYGLFILLTIASYFHRPKGE